MELDVVSAVGKTAVVTKVENVGAVLVQVDAPSVDCAKAAETWVALQ